MSTLNEIGDTLADTMPEVSDHAIAEHQEAQERNNQANTATPTAENPNGWPLDGRGKPYNPATHEISEATGKAIKKRRGGQKSTIGSTTGAQPTAPNEAQAQAITAAANGRFAAMATFAALQGVFGEEFKPRADAQLGDEFQFLSASYGDYFLAKGIQDVPPGIALVIAIGSIVAPRFSMPKTRTRVQRIKDFFVGKFFSWRAKKTVKEAAENTKEGKLNA